ncbi:hypothetical protein Ancab_024468 [Ancistrocladus abbreviatus]
MEDPSEEWRIQEYPPREEESNSKLSWIWDKGLRLGMKLVFTGVVISSAPFVLPPLVVLSALAVTFSVPVGLVFVSCACTGKLISHLLSELRPPPLLEYGTTSSKEEEEHKVDREGQDDAVMEAGYVEMLDYETTPRHDGYDMEAEEEEEFEEDVKKRADMQIELVDDGTTEIEEEDIILLDTEGVVGIDKDRKAVMEGVNVTAEEDEYEQDVGESVGKEKAVGEILKGIREAEQELSSLEEGRREMSVDVTAEENGYKGNAESVKKEEAVGEILKGIREAEEEPSSMKEGRREMPVDAVIVAEAGGKDDSYIGRVEVLAPVLPKEGEEKCGYKHKFGDVDEEELARETTGLVEAFRDERKDDNGKEVNVQSMRENCGIVGSGEIKVPSENQNVDGKIGLQKDSRYVERAKQMEKDEEILLEDKTEDRKSPDVVMIPVGFKLGGDTLGVVEGTRCDRNLNSISIEAEALKTDGGSSGGGDIGSCTAMKQKPIMEKKLVVHAKRTGNHTSTVISEEVSSDRKEATLVLSSEVGQGLLDQGYGCGAPEMDSYSDGRKHKEVETASSDIIDRSMDYREFPISLGVSVPKPVETVLQQETTAGPNEALPNAAKIWEEIHAMRMIVGYKATPRASCVEELKALYVFTGVEPPASVKDPSDVEDINEKLHFLKSIIGVK